MCGIYEAWIKLSEQYDPWWLGLSQHQRDYFVTNLFEDPFVIENTNNIGA